MDEKVNILFLVDKFNIGGVQKSNVDMINKIDKDKFNVHVLYVKEGMLMEDLKLHKIFISKLGSKLKLKSLINIKYIYKTVKYIMENDIDVIHTIDPVLYIVGATSAKLANVKHVRTQPNFIRRHEKLNSRTLKLLPFERWTNMFITYQYGSAKDLELAGVDKDKIEVIRGFSTLEEFMFFNNIKDIRKEFGIPIENKIILAMHRMVEKKGYETFIDMIPFVIKEYSNVTFLLVGDGPLRDSLEERVKSLGVDKYVRFTGFRKDIANIIKQIDFGVYPLADTAAMVTVIRAGKVLITKRNSSMDEYIVDGMTGYLVKDDKPETYAEYVLMLLKDDTLLKELEKNQKEFVIKNFDGNKNVKKLENIFISLCKSNKK